MKIAESQSGRGAALTRAATIVVMGAGALLMAPKCGPEITVPAADATPPSAKLVVVRDGVSEEVPASGMTKKIGRADHVTILVLGRDDDGGIRRVTVRATADTVCASGTLKETLREQIVESETDQVRRGEVGTTQLLTSTVLKGQLECGSGYEGRSKQLVVSGSATNHAGAVTTTPTLVIDVDLAPAPSE